MARGCHIQDSYPVYMLSSLRITVTCFCLIQIFQFPCALQFNIDTGFPIMFTGKQGSHFGYTVAISKQKTGNLILAGAPGKVMEFGPEIDSIPDNLKHTGTVYKCSFDHLQCGQIDFIDKKNISRQEWYTNSWLGGTMAASSQLDGVVVVCGHRYAQISNKENRGIGICYLFADGLDNPYTRKLAPLNDSKLWLIPKGKNKVVLYQNGASGFSVDLGKDDKYLTLGAPGLFDYRGGVTQYSRTTTTGSAVDNDDHVRRERRAAPDIFPHHSTPPVLLDANMPKPNDYLAYSLSSSIDPLTKEPVYVAGAPRAANNRGMVVVYKPSHYLPIEITASRQSDNFGSYFGASVLLVRPSSSHRYNQLLIGAPMWSSFTQTKRPHVEQGNVFVYRVSQDRIQPTSHAVVGQPSTPTPLAMLGHRAQPWARFGTCITAIGDIDIDGYQDIAVGSPYEDLDRGVIYIYMGTSEDISLDYSQRISARSLHYTISGFGISISSSVDLDNNYYPDLAVGALLTERAVVLRAKPVVRFQSQFYTHTKRLAFHDSNFTVFACWTLEHHYFINRIAASVQLNVVSRHVPLQFEKTKAHTLSYKMNTTIDGVCKSFNVKVKQVEDIDYSTPMEIEMSLNITDPLQQAPYRQETSVVADSENATRDPKAGRSANVDRDAFCANCPVVDPRQQRVTLVFPFDTDCGHDLYCLTDLSVSATLAGASSEYFIVGSTATLEMVVSVTNNGEMASLPMLNIVVRPPLAVARVTLNCDHLRVPHLTNLTCKIRPHPLLAGHTTTVSVFLHMERVPQHYPSVHLIQLAVSSSSRETNPADNRLDYQLQTILLADIAFTGSPVPELIYYDKRDEERDDAESNATRDKGAQSSGSAGPSHASSNTSAPSAYRRLVQRYQITFYQYSAVTGARLQLFVPVSVRRYHSRSTAGRHVRVIEVLGVRAQLANSLYPGCQILGDAAPDFTASEGRRVGPAQVRIPYGVRQHLKRDAPPVEAQDHNGTIQLSCTQPNTVRCVRVVCENITLSAEHTKFRLLLSLGIDIRLLERITDRKEKFIVSTFGMLSMPANVGIFDAGHRAMANVTQVHTIVLPSTHVPFPVWIIILAVIGALIMLAIITYVLYKVGFFKRRRSEYNK